MTLEFQVIGLLLVAAGSLGMPYPSNFSPKMTRVSERPIMDRRDDVCTCT